MTVPAGPLAPVRHPDLELLDRLQRKVLWLATAMVHHANRVRPNASGVKVGGHQASSASLVSVMSALWFAHLDAEDRVSVKPHASPVLHAINYLLGDLDRGELTRLREYGGLQSYPSRSKDPDQVDYSTGSVGIGATATIWGALAQRYVSSRFDVPPAGRQIALLGDAELDEGAIWEAVADPMVASLGELLWVVDLNRQSLDRVVPDIAVGRLQAMFAAAGWQVLTLKYGRELTRRFEGPGGSELRARIDRMSNEEYQRLLRSDGHEIRERLPGSGAGRRALAALVGDVGDEALTRLIRDLGGHDLRSLLDAFASADADPRPTVVFAYTIKGWSLPTEGHPSNHSALLDEAQFSQLAERLGEDAGDPWPPPAADSPEAAWCERRRAALRRPEVPSWPTAEVPAELRVRHVGRLSTQQAFGRLFVDLANDAPDVARQVVTVSPDVASSTNLGGWINKTGVWNAAERTDWFADDSDTLVRWREAPEGQHVELGIAEVNLVGLLSELGATWSRYGQPLLPVGTIYDPFVARALEPWSFGIYAGGQSILIGTPSGVTLGPEGGAHQSVITPSIGIEQPGCTAWEPAFAHDFEWTFLHALSRLGRPDGTSAYFRLSTRPIDQALAAVPTDEAGRARRRREVLEGGYRLGPAPVAASVRIVAVGAIVVQALEAADVLREQAGWTVDVICLTSPDLIFRALRARQGLGEEPYDVLGRLFPEAAPLVSIVDGHPHTLAFLASVHAAPIACLGVAEFGQSGDIADLYRHHGIDADGIVDAALDVVPS